MNKESKEMSAVTITKDNFELEVASRDKAERSYIYTRPDAVKGPKETVIINKDKSEINILWTTGKDKKVMFKMGDMPDVLDLSQLQSQD